VVNWDQLKTIIWLRWRLTRNMWMRQGGFGAVIAALVAFAAYALGAASFVGALLGGMALGHATAFVVWAIWCGVTVAFLFLWMIGLAQEIQRSETIDLQRLMHLPVALGQIFVINYLASHLAFSIMIFVPAMMGLAIGLTISRGSAMLLLIPLFLSMVFMITAWTYCLRGWLATLMSNPRRRRNVVMVIVFTFILLGQGPNLYINVFHGFQGHGASVTGLKMQRQHEGQDAALKDKFVQLQSVQKFIPPLWLPLGAQALAGGSVLPALFGTFGCFVIGALGLSRSYRGTVRFYRGESGGKVASRAQPIRKPAGVAAPAAAGSSFMELRLPVVPEQSAALALATFRSLLRAPEVKMAWGASIIVPLIIGVSILFRRDLKIPEAASPFVATGAVLFSVFMLVQFFSNQFGFDRDAFRSLILSSADRKFILLGKNLACFPVGAGFGVILLALFSVRLQLSSLVVLATLLQLGALLLMAGVVGNMLSILAPYRIQPGTMKPTKMPGLAMVVLMFSHLLFPFAMAPVFLAPLAELLWRTAGWPEAVPVNLILSMGLLGLVALVYWQTLGPLGRLLQRRETRILGIVTVEVE